MVPHTSRLSFVLANDVKEIVEASLLFHEKDNIFHRSVDLNLRTWDSETIDLEGLAQLHDVYLLRSSESLCFVAAAVPLVRANFSVRMEVVLDNTAEAVVVVGGNGLYCLCTQRADTD